MSAIYLVDTDMALDDWMALLYLLQSPLADVKSITIAATGESHAKAGAKNALRLVALTDAPLPEVAMGRKTPLRGNHRFPLLIRLIMDIMFFLRLPRAKGKVLQKSAVSTLKHHITAASDDIVIIALGPMTNIAELLQNEPDLAKKITMIYQMGGALDVGGNLHEINKSLDNPYAEWNIYIDPYAAEVVFRSHVPLTLIPLDATTHVPLTKNYIDRFAAENLHPSTDFVLREMKRIFPLTTKNKFYFWDVIVAVVATHPHVAQFEQRRLRVITEEGRESGRIVDDPDGSEIRVCTHFDGDAFERLFLDTLNQKVAND